jgi:predicted amidohydrolase YtcJ
MPEPADLILVGGSVWCGDAARRWATAVAVRDDRIVAVGTDDDVRPHRGPSTEVLNLPGRMIVPGFQDAHIHPAFAGRNLLHVNLDDLSSREAYLDRIAAYAAEHPDVPWVYGGGWSNPVFTATEGPRREDLDAIVPDRPVFLMNNDVHGAWVNSKALAVAGITASTPDPWDGYFVRDPDGSPTGTLQEGAAYSMLRDVVARPGLDLWKACIRRALTELHALGVTGWQDAWVEPDLLAAYRSLEEEGALTARVVAALWWDRHAGMEQIEAFEAQRAEGRGGILATAVKIMLDGCPETCTGSMLAPYEGAFGTAHGSGLQFVEAGALAEAVVALDARGFQVHQHALGDRAVRSALDAVEAARTANGPNDLRHHIAHLQLPDPLDLPRLRRLGVIANLQPFWAQPDPAIQALTIPRVGERAARLYPIGAIAASGAVMAFGSDWPVSTPNPFLEMEVAVTRRPPGEPEAEPLDAAQAIDLGSALSAFTSGSAYLNHDDEAGQIRPGFRADLVVVDRNPFDRRTGGIGEARVELTIASGRVVHGGS